MEASLSFDPELTPKKQIRNLLFLLLSAIACAFLLTFFFLYNYNPEKHYLLKNALVSPEVISQMSASGENQKSKMTPSTILEKIEFSYPNIEEKKRIALAVNKQTYSKFYQMIKDDKSALEISDAISAAFNEMPAASLTLMVSSPSQHNQLFQEVQFLYKGDYYRIKLRQSETSDWVYFYHPHIYNDVYTLLTEDQSHES